MHLDTPVGALKALKVMMRGIEGHRAHENQIWRIQFFMIAFGPWARHPSRGEGIHRESDPWTSLLDLRHYKSSSLDGWLVCFT